jgi:hypothetical protein
MDDLKSNLTTDNFYNILHSIDIEVEEDDIFYRRKYNGIMNYFKMILTHNENSLLLDYSKIITPKGLLLVKINQNSDLNDFLKLVSKNYFLDVIELNYEEIFFNYSYFFEQFQEIIQEIISLEKKIPNTSINNKPNSTVDDLKTTIRRIFIIDENQLFFKKNDPFNLLDVFINSKLNKINFIENNCIIIWITNKISNLYLNSQKIFEIFDLFINIPPLDRSERESVLKHFSELFPRIVFDVETIANYTKLWEVNDFKQLLKLGIFNHFLKSELNQKSNEITDILIELIETREFIPSVNSVMQNNQESMVENHILQSNNNYNFKAIDFREYENVKAYQKEIQEENISHFMRNQLYEHAASKHYKELQMIIEKISKHEALEENERSILAKYPFILNENPHKALITLEKAKKKINRISQIFKGT